MYLALRFACSVKTAPSTPAFFLLYLFGSMEIFYQNKLFDLSRIHFTILYMRMSLLNSPYEFLSQENKAEQFVGTFVQAEISFEGIFCSISELGC